VRISAITLDTLLELVGGQVIQELGEDGLSGIHPSLSAIGVVCGHSAIAVDSARAISNRKMRVISYRFYYVIVTACSPFLAGHYWNFIKFFSCHELSFHAIF